MPEKILIIDDDLDTLRLVGLMLQKKGYQIVAANNGKQGLLKVEEEAPDLILLDVMMPEMDGYEVARRLRENPATDSIPILMFTAKSQLDDKVTGFESGVDDYLTKPTHPTELHAHVKALLARSVTTTDKDAASKKKKAFTVGLLSARGGLGVSSLALNLASTLHVLEDEDTIIAELIPGGGTIGRDLGFSSFNEFAKLLNKTPQDIAIAPDTIREALSKHESGIQVLPASENPKDMALSSKVPQFEAVFAHLQSFAPYLVVDFGAGLPALSQALLPRCQQVIVIIEAFENSIAHAKQLLENIYELGIEKEKVLVVLNNRMRSDMQLSSSQVKEQMDLPIEVTVTPAPELFFQAKRMHTIPSFQKDDSMTAQQFQQLAKIILENKAKEA